MPALINHPYVRGIGKNSGGGGGGQSSVGGEYFFLEWENLCWGRKLPGCPSQGCLSQSCLMAYNGTVSVECTYMQESVVHLACSNVLIISIPVGELRVSWP